MTWDRAMNKYNCSVYAFDMTLMQWTNTQIEHGLHFLDLGLANFSRDVSVGGRFTLVSHFDFMFLFAILLGITEIWSF